MDETLVRRNEVPSSNCSVLLKFLFVKGEIYACKLKKKLLSKRYWAGRARSLAGKQICLSA